MFHEGISADPLQLVVPIGIVAAEGFESGGVAAEGGVVLPDVVGYLR